MTQEIEVDQGPDGRWHWTVGGIGGYEQSRDAAYDRARDAQRTVERIPKREFTRSDM